MNVDAWYVHAFPREFRTKDRYYLVLENEGSSVRVLAFELATKGRVKRGEIRLYPDAPGLAPKAIPAKNVPAAILKSAGVTP